MRFLFNATLFSVFDLAETLEEAGCPLSPDQARQLGLAVILGLVREAIWTAPDLAESDPNRARVLAVLIAHASPANALLAVRPVSARQANQVCVRLADINLPTMVHLDALAAGGYLTPSRVDQVVWARAGAHP